MRVVVTHLLVLRAGVEIVSRASLVPHHRVRGRQYSNAPAVTLREFVRILGEEANLAPQVSALPRAVTRAAAAVA
jgi:hypothetical protein